MKLFDFLDQSVLDQPTPTPEALAYRYNISLDEVLDQLVYGTIIEMEHTNEISVAMEIAMDHLAERIDYYEELAKIDESDMEEARTRLGKPGKKRKKVYPGQSSATLANYVARKYGGEVGCGRAAQIVNDPNVNKNIKKRAIWYRSLHCRGTKQVREVDSMPTDQQQIPGQGAALTIWDIDDTLFKTSAKVMVKGEHGPPKELSSSEFNSYQLGPNEQFDFSQFRDARLFHATSKPIENIWKTAQNTLDNIGKRPGSRMVVVTARSDLDDKDLFLDTFRKHGMDMSKVHVYRAGNLAHGSSAANKKVIIRNLLNAGNYTEARLFDDHRGNLEAFLDLKKEFPSITFKAFPVSHSGKVGSPIIV